VALDWAVPGFPHEPQDEQQLLIVDGAFLSRMAKGPLRTAQPPNKWLRGAVYDSDGLLIPASQKIGGLGGNQGAQADPERLRPRPGARRLTGTWMYGGHWIGHFGHFFTETLTTLWPERQQVDGLVFHAYFGGNVGIKPWQAELMDLTGYGDLPIEVVDREPVTVDRLVVPSRSVVVNGWAHPGAAAVWDRMVAAAGGPTPGSPERVFLSRTSFNAGLRAQGKATRSTEARDRALDEVFAASDYDVVTSEALPVLDQVRLAAGAKVLAGCAGTALHLSAFAPAGTRVIEIGDTRSPDVQVPQQQVIDHLRGHPTAFLPASLEPADVAVALADLAELAELADLAATSS
jgi:capsular polysaccharide biosynthesis protein